MRTMFILRRPGILVIKGLVTEVTDSTVRLEDCFFYPVSRREETTTCILDCEEEYLQRIQLKTGAKILAATTDDFKIEMLLEGGETPVREYHLRGYRFCYNGSFDFERYMDSKEQHVFSGTVMSVNSGEKQGYTWNRLMLGWSQNGKNERRNIVYWNDQGISLADKEGQRLIVVTGEPKAREGVRYYQASAVYDF